MEYRFNGRTWRKTYSSCDVEDANDLVERARRSGHLIEGGAASAIIFHNFDTMRLDTSCNRKDEPNG